MKNVKIRILQDFPSVDYGMLKAKTEITCSEQFADYAVNRMRDAAEYVESKKKPSKK